MPLLDIPVHVVEENIRDKKRLSDLQEVKDDNNRLHIKETGFQESVTAAKAALVAYEGRLAMVQRNLEMAKQSVATVKAERPTFTHALDEHVSTLTTF